MEVTPLFFLECVYLSLLYNSLVIDILYIMLYMFSDKSNKVET